MTKLLLTFFINYLMFKISHAQYASRGLPNTSPTNAKVPLSPTPTALNAPSPVPTIERITPKCYPETATVYFLPAPPSSPKITILNSKSKDENPNLSKLQEIIPKEVPVGSPNKLMTSQAFPLPPPPPCDSPSTTELPNLIDEIPTIIQDRFSRLALEDKNIACETCASLIKKLPIFNFDQELLDGFLTGIGLS